MTYVDIPLIELVHEADFKLAKIDNDFVRSAHQNAQDD